MVVPCLFISLCDFPNEKVFQFVSKQKERKRKDS